MYLDNLYSLDGIKLYSTIDFRGEMTDFRPFYTYQGDGSCNYIALKTLDGKCGIAKTRDVQKELSDKVILTIDSNIAYVLGQKSEIDAAPVIRNGRTMLPARFVAENLGATVDWDNNTKTVTIKNDNAKITITINSDTAYVNGEAVKLDSPAFIENSRTYTPVRFIAEALNAKVDWNSASRNVLISKN